MKLSWTLLIPWILKRRTDAEGNIIWEKDYGGEDDAMFYSLVKAGKDEYVILGQIAVSYTRQESDMYLVKVDGEGNEIWSHTYGGRGMDHAKMVRQTADGGYILIGSRADEFPTQMGSEYGYQADIVLIKTLDFYLDNVCRCFYLFCGNK